MANDYIALPADGAGKKSQTFSNSISGNTVHATAVSLVTSAGTSCDPPSGTGVASCGNVNSGSADSGAPVKVGGVYNSSAPTFTTGQRADLQVDANGNLKVVNQSIDSAKKTYSAAIQAFATAGSATDVFTITAGATRVVRITRIAFSATTNANYIFSVLLIKRSTANTGGTSTSLTAVPHDSTDAAADATVKYYTANPAGLGTAVGTIRAAQFISNNQTTNPLTCQVLEWTFGDGPSKGIVLRGTTESLNVNLALATLATGAVSIEVEWTEEP